MSFNNNESTLTFRQSISRYALTYGLYTALGLLAYFITMHLLGLARLVNLRFFNFFVLLAGAFMVLKKFYGDDESRQGNYFAGLRLGLFTSVIATAIFSVGIYVFLKLIDPALAQAILATTSGYGLPSIEFLTLMVFFEGSMSGIIISLIAMQFYK